MAKLILKKAGLTVRSSVKSGISGFNHNKAVVRK